MYHIIINPASQSGNGLKIWKEQVEPALHQEKISYRSYFSRCAGDVAKLAAEIMDTVEGNISLIILGGDGTVNEALQGIQDTSRVTLGYIPTGSSNDLARDLHIPRDISAALDIILHTGKARPMDLGTVTYKDGESLRFVVSCGIGFDAAVCEEAQHSRIKKFFNKIGLGKLTYLGIALKQLFAARAIGCTLSLDDQPPIDIHSVLFVACMLHRYEGGGFLFSPDAKDGDGILNLCAVGDLPKLLVLFALPTAFWGKHYMFKGVNPYKAQKIKIETTAPLWVHTDGEVSRKATSLTVTCQHHALQMITP